MTTFTDEVLSGSGVRGVYVQLVNNTTSTVYAATGPTSPVGVWTATAPPGTYSVYTSLTGTGSPPGSGWTLFNSNYIVTDPFSLADLARTVSPTGLAATGVTNNGAQYGPDTAGTTTSGIQEAINSLPTASLVDSNNLTATGPVGRIELLGGVFVMSGTISVGACDLVISGAGSGGWAPNGTGTATTRRQGTLVYSTANATGQGCFKTVPNTNGNVNSTLVIHDVDFALLSPAAASWANPPAVNLGAWQTGGITNVIATEITASGGIGNNLYIVFDVEPGAQGGPRAMHNCQGFGGNVGLALHVAGGQITSCGGGSTASTIVPAGADAGVSIIDDLHTFYENVFAYSSGSGFILTPYAYGQPFTPLVISRLSCEAVSHYMRPGQYASSGTVILNSPCWDSLVDPSTDIAAQIAASAFTYSISANTGLAVISHDELDPHARGITRHVTVPPGSWTAGTSPFTLGPRPFDAIFVITTVGGMTALTLDGQAIFNGTFTVGQQIHVGAGHMLVATWATTAPVFRVLPL